MRAHEFITEFVTADDLHKIEHRVNSLWDKDNIGVNLHQTSNKHELGHSHFLQRANDSRNKPPISAQEIEDLFVDAHKVGTTRNQIKSIDPGSEAVITDKETDLNVPIIVNRGEDEKEIIPKTIMRKRDFKSYAPKINLPSTKNATNQFAQAFGKLRDINKNN
jgi:hypothetical protein